MASHREIRQRKREIRNSYNNGVQIDEICKNFDISYDYFTKCLFPDELKKHKTLVKNAKKIIPEQPPTDSPNEERKTERLAEIVDMATEGRTLQEIGEELGLSRERIRQILAKEGLRVKDFKRLKIDNRARLKVEINDWVEHHPGCRIEEIENRFGLQRKKIYPYLTGASRGLLLSTPLQSKGRAIRKFSEEDTLNALRMAFEFRNPMMGLYAHQERIPVTGPYYERLRRSGQIHGPSESRIIQIFGTWSRACERAGIDSKVAARNSYNSTWTDHQLITLVACFLRESKKSSAREFDEWCRLDKTRPSSGTVRNKFESWELAKQLALFELRESWATPKSAES
jgi:hypothetical protein